MLRNKTVVKAIGFSLFMTIIMYFIVENPKPNTAIYFLVVLIVSFTSFCIIKLIASKAYEKFMKEIGHF